MEPNLKEVELNQRFTRLKLTTLKKNEPRGSGYSMEPNPKEVELDRRFPRLKLTTLKPDAKQHKHDKINGVPDYVIRSGTWWGVKGENPIPSFVERIIRKRETGAEGGHERQLMVKPRNATAVNAFHSTLVIQSILSMLCERIVVDDEDKKNAMFNALHQKLTGLDVINPLCNHEALAPLRDGYYRLINALVLEHSLPTAASTGAENNLIVAKPKDVVVLKDSFTILSKLMPAKWSPMFLLHLPRYRSDFEEVRVLGKGGFGKVVEARNLLDKRHYAIKQIKLRCKDHDSFENVIREVNLLASLNHPNVVSYCTSWYENSATSDSSSDLSQNTMSSGDASSQSVEFAQSSPPASALRRNYFARFPTSRQYASDEMLTKDAELRHREPSDTFSTKDDDSLSFKHEERIKKDQGLGITLYIQMELCGINLENYLQKRNNRLSDSKLKDPMGAIDIDQCDDIFNQVVNAVEYIHSKNLMHRDIKPPNIFMGNNCKYVKIGDFGLARMEMASGLDIEPLTPISKYGEMGTFTAKIGTGVYAAPEQLSSKHYDKKADMYSMGMVYFELLYPFGSGMERAIKLTRLRETSGNCKEVQEIGERWLDNAEVIRSLLHNSPSERMSARELLEKRNATKSPSEILENLQLRLAHQDELVSHQALSLAEKDVQMGFLRDQILEQKKKIHSLKIKNKRLKDEQMGFLPDQILEQKKEIHSLKIKNKRLKDQKSRLYRVIMILKRKTTGLSPALLRERL